MSGLRGRLLLAVTSLGLFLLLLEGLSQWAEPRPLWEEDLEARDLGVYRVVVLGGSTAWGSPVPELGLAAQLEALLQRHKPRTVREVEVRNLGRSGFPSSFVRRLLSHLADRGEIDLFVVLTGHNEFLDRIGMHSSFARWAFDHSFDLATTRLLTRLLPRPAADPMPEQLVPVDRAGGWFQRRLSDYEDNLHAIADAARRHEIPLLLLTAPANLAEWSPVFRDLGDARDADYERDMQRIRAHLEAGRRAEAETAIAARQSRSGGDAMLLFLQGRLELLRGNPSRALDFFQRAKDADPYPWRALSRQNQAVRGFAGRSGVAVVDAEASFAAHAPGGLVGFALVADNVHPTPLGYALMADGVARAMQGDALLIPRDAVIEAPDVALALYLAELEKAGQRGPLEHMRLLREGLYVMKTPFYDYVTARRYLEGARDLAPHDWRAWANLGVLSLLEGDHDGGLRELRRAAERLGKPLDPGDTPNLPYLEIALARSGVTPGPDVVAPGVED